LLRRSALALGLAVIAWSAGCATAPPPIVDAAFASGAYAPARVAVLPPDVFVVLDQVGDNDPVQSAALGQAVSAQTVRAVEQSLRARGYDVDLSSRWDGIAGGDGTMLVNRDELGWLANGVLQFGNSRASGQVPPATPGYIAPELAAKVGWATQSDALLYVNVKGVATTSGKRTASILAGVFIVVIVAAIVLAILASSKNGGGKAPTQGVAGGNGFRGQSVPRASGATAFRGTPPSASGFRGAPGVGGHAGAMPSGATGGFHGAPAGGGAASAMPSGGGAAGAMPSGGAMSSAPRAGGAAGAMPSGGAMSAPRPAAGAPAPAASGGWRGGSSPAAPSGAPSGGWRGGGSPPPPPPGAYVYGGRPAFGLGVGIDVVVPLDGPAYTHDGDVQHEDEMFAGDELWVSMTLVSTYDGRVLWHERQELDLDADDPQDVDRMVGAFLNSLPPRGGFPPAATAKK
jgi:hypothetical protein